jgi:serine/threonine protein kinase
MAQVGDLLAGKYTLEARLGAGAMGEVWKAKAVDLSRDVAIKILRREHAGDREIVARFLREARAANLVRHANVVDVLDVGEDAEGTPFLVEELLDGEDLGAHLTAHGGLPVDAAMKVLVPIVEAVAFAHGRGVVHRDIKPENVFLARTGATMVPKLLDFGISHVAVEGGARMTATGVALGTPAYMSPEQIKGARNVDARSDVWSLGVLLHETLSGELPFKGETVADHFVQIATGTPVPLEIAAPHAPRALARIVARCLKRSPADRYQDAGTLLFDLEAVAAESRPGRAQLPLASAEPRRSAATELGQGSPRPSGAGVEAIEIEPLAAAAPWAAPPLTRPRVARTHSIRPAPVESAGRRLAVSAGVTATALAAASVLATLNLWPEEWILAGTVTGLFAGLGAAAARGVAAGAVALAAGMALRGWRREPKSLGHFVLAASVSGVAVVALAASTGQMPWSVMPWAAAGAAVGVAAMAVRSATDAWLDDLRGDAVLRSAAATAAFFAARLLMR